MTARSPNTSLPPKAKAAAKRAAKGSVQEAIGTIIGDDAARERGKAEKTAAKRDGPDKPSSRT